MPAALAVPGKPNWGLLIHSTAQFSVGIIEASIRYCTWVVNDNFIILQAGGLFRCLVCTSHVGVVGWSVFTGDLIEKICLAGPIFLGRKKPTLTMFRLPFQNRIDISRCVALPARTYPSIRTFEYIFNCCICGPGVNTRLIQLVPGGGLGINVQW